MSDFSELDNFLAGAVQRKTAVDVITSAKNTRLGAKPGTDEWRSANATVQAWERKHEWFPAVYQALFAETVCSCGNRVESFEGFFTKAQHKTKPTVEHKRIRAEDVAGLYLEQLAQVREILHVNICINCWATKGKKDA